MSFQTFVTERLAAITEMLNAILTNAKKIDELPDQQYLDPSSKIHVSIAGVSQQISVSQIINAIESSNFDEIVAVGTPIIQFNSGTGINEVIVPALPTPTWRISNVYYSKSGETKEDIPFAATGLNRFDNLLMNTLNQIVIQRGTETAGIAIAPTKPLNTIILSQIYVTDNTVGDPTIPVDVSNKLDKGGYQGTAADLVLAIQIINSSEKTTCNDNDKIGIADSEDSNKTKFWKFSTFKKYFQAKDKQIEIDSSTDVHISWNGQTIIFKASCTITVRGTLPDEFSFNAITLEGVSVAWAKAAPYLWRFGTPPVTPEKSYLNFTRIGSTNDIVIGT